MSCYGASRKSIELVYVLDDGDPDGWLNGGIHHWDPFIIRTESPLCRPHVVRREATSLGSVDLPLIY